MQAGWNFRKAQGASRRPLTAANAIQNIAACQPPESNIGPQCRRSCVKNLVNALDLWHQLLANDVGGEDVHVGCPLLISYELIGSIAQQGK